jgi:nucleoside-diphosphate-sugar epimerase
MRLLLTGAPGWLADRFLGTLSQFPSDFSYIRCLVQPGKDLVGPLSKWECFHADITQEHGLREVVRGMDVVLHLAGVLHVRRIADFYTINREGTRNLLKACRAEGVRRFIYVSTNAAQGFCPPGDAPLRESDACNPRSHYGRSKYEAEQIVREHQGEEGFQTVIVRPAMFFGPPVPLRHVGIIKRVQSGIFPVFGDGNYLRSITYIDNLVQALHLIIHADAADGKTYAITDDEIPTLNQIIQAIAEALEVDVRIIRLPRVLASAAHGVDDVISALGFYWMLPHIVGEACKEIAYDISKAKEELGYNPKIRYKEGYMRMIQWCREQRLI